ncbi:MAG: hypothetical protein NTZ40_10300 [Cyanobacteria bacterium]|nr:hypothetical protein [Cyanobacteriota bacterium]
MTQTPSTNTSTTSTTSTPQNTCSVTNNLILPTSPSTPAQTDWDGGIVVISGYNTSSTSTAQGYLQSDLTLLSFIDEGASASSESSTTSSVLPLNETGTLNLLPYYQPGSTTQVNTVYNLLVSQANNYFPVAAVGEIKMGRNFAPVSLPQAAPSNSSSGANAYVFLQNMMAYPSSPLAQQFTAALNQDNSASPATGSSAAVNTFFAGTTSFTNVNFNIYSSVSSYASAYAYIWANFQQSYTYHFYTVTPASDNSSSATGTTDVKESEQFSSLGTVVFTQSGYSPAAISDANAGYTITWNPKGGTAVGLNFLDGQLVANNSDGFSGFCLQTTFMDMAQLTGNSADTGIPIQALVGVINGSNVIGSAVELSETEGAKWSKGFNDVLKSKTFEAIQIGMSLFFMIDIGVKLCEWIKEKCSRGESPSADEVTKAQSDIKDEAQEKAEDAGNDEELKTGDAVGEEQANAESSVLNAEAEEAEASEIDEQFTEEEVQAALEDNSTIDDEVENTDEEETELEDVNPESSDASSELESIQDQISSTQSTIVSENQALGDASSAEVQQQDATVEEEDDDEAEDEKEEEADEDGDFDDVDDLADLD